MERLWNDDPEELLLDLGFGCDEPDLSGRIPARFINYQSQARGINLQVFLEAQRSRIDLENPDVSNRFRQLEVLQEVSVAFSSLAGPLKGRKDMSPEARERRRRMGMLFRRASKKSLSQLHSPIPQELTVATAVNPSAVMHTTGEPMYGPEERKVRFKRVKLQDTVSLSPFVEEEGDGIEAEVQDGTNNKTAHSPEGEPRVGTSRERFLERALQRKKSLQMRDSFEMEELCSFDEGSPAGVDSVGTHFARGLIRVNSCQSDSSGFLEDPLIPTLPQDPSPAPDLIKALSALSGGSTESHSSDLPPLSSVCSPNAVDHTTEHLTGTSSNLLQIPTATTDCGVSPQSKQRTPQENGILSTYNDLSSYESVAFEQQEAGVNNTSSDNDTLQKEIGMEAKTVYFVSSPKHHKSFHSTDFDEFPLPRPQKSVSSKEVYQSPVKKKPIVVTHFLSRQDSVDDLNMNNEKEMLQYNQDVMEVRSVVSDLDSSRLQTEEVYMETEIDWLDMTQEFEESQSELFQKGWNGIKDDPILEMLVPKVSELIEIESLDDVFETSVDASEVDTGDVEAFFQEMHSIGQVYWAEPIHIDDRSPQSVSFEDQDTFQEDNKSAMESDQGALSSTQKAHLENERSFTDFSNRNIQQNTYSVSLTSLEDTPKHSISVQMLSNSSSHIVDRKDIPYMDNPKHKVLPKHFKLDTSNPFRAVQSWTNLHIQYHSNVKASKMSNSAGGNLNRPAESYWPPYSALAHEWQSDDCLHKMSREEGSPFISMDMGLWADNEDEEVDRRVGQSGQNKQTCCTCDHKCNCCIKDNQRLFSQRELEGLLLYLQKFWSVLCLMEEQATEEQATVYGALTQHDRQCLEELLQLRQAVRREVQELELQLSDLEHHHDHSLTLGNLSSAFDPSFDAAAATRWEQWATSLNMLRLLDEQSLLCSQLQLYSPGPHTTLSGLVHKRTVATQCSPQDGAPSPPQQRTASSHQGLGCAPAKTDKRHLVGFLHRLRDSIRH